MVKKLNNISSNESDASDYDDDDDDDEGGSDSDVDADSEKTIPCPRDCICKRNYNGYMVATCSR